MYTYGSIHEPKQFTYDVLENIKDNVIKYTFISEGQRNIMKVVEYVLLEECQGIKLFNFGFGDYNLADGITSDAVISNNGDVYRVFHTVLNTVPRFFKIHPGAIMVVEGSDSSREFADACRANCKRNCITSCRNANRRINIYRGYINKHYRALNISYTFYGGFAWIDNKLSMTDYKPHSKQKSIIVSKNKNQHYMNIEDNLTEELMETTPHEEIMAWFMEKYAGIESFPESNERVRQALREGKL